MLIVEDSADDAELVLRSLQKADYEVEHRRVDTAPAMAQALADGGVETPAQLAFLRERGCDQIQGYLLGRPMPPEAMARFWQASPNQASQG